MTGQMNGEQFLLCFCHDCSIQQYNLCFFFFYAAFEGVFEASISRVICPRPMTAHIFRGLNGCWEFSGDLSYSGKPFPQLISAFFLPNENELDEFISPSTGQDKKESRHVIVQAEISMASGLQANFFH